MIQQNYAYLLMNPNLHPSVREAFTREATYTQDAEVAEEIRKRDLWKKLVALNDRLRTLVARTWLAWREVT